jgi:hypothetical protein
LKNEFETELLLALFNTLQQIEVIALWGIQFSDLHFKGTLARDF